MADRSEGKSHPRHSATILDRQIRQGQGAKVIDRLVADLREALPEMKGFSSRNLEYMKFFAQRSPVGLIGQQPVALVPPRHLSTGAE